MPTKDRRHADQRSGEKMCKPGHSRARPTKAFVSARASPPPKDDFDEDAFGEASNYKAVRANIKERKLVSDENKNRVAGGLKALRLPSKVEEKKDPLLKRRRRDEDEPEDLDLQELPFNPLPVLAKLPREFDPHKAVQVLDRENPNPAELRRLFQLDPIPPGPRQLFWERKQTKDLLDEIGHSSDSKVKDDIKLPNTRRDSFSDDDYGDDSMISYGSPRGLGPKSAITPMSPFRPQADVETEKPDVKHDVKPDVQPEIKPNVPDVKPVISEDVKPDISAVIKPDISQDAKPSVSADVKPEPVTPDAKPDIKSDVKPDVKLDVSDEGDDYEDDDYDEDDPSNEIIFLQSKPAGVYGDVEDDYSDDDIVMVEPPSQAPVVPRPQEIVVERPAFHFMGDIADIEPFRLDEDVVVPASINKFLRSYQRSGVEFLYKHYKLGTGCILGDDMGLGKTVQVISFLAAIMRKTGIQSVDEERRKRILRPPNPQIITPKQWPTALIVCPKSLMFNWARELHTWGFFEFEVWPHIKSQRSEVITKMNNGYLDLILTSSTLVTRNIEELVKLPFSVIIVDEGHKMKTHKADLTLAMKRFRNASCFALTGTLIQNRMEEMWSVLDFVQRGWAGTREQWRDYATRPISRGHRFDGTVPEVVRMVQRLAVLHDQILPHFILRRDKRILADELPKKRDTIYLCKLSRRQIDVYQKVITSPDAQFILRSKELCDCESERTRLKCCYQLSPMGDQFKTAILKMFGALGRTANHLALLYPDESDKVEAQQATRRTFELVMGETYRAEYSNAVEAERDPGNCGKWEVLLGLLRKWLVEPSTLPSDDSSSKQDTDPNKVLIFSNSVRLLKILKYFIDLSVQLSSINAEMFTGATSQQERTEIVDRFQDPDSNLSVMLISTMAGGVGLNLTAANKVIIFDPNWNPANDLQAMDRAYRIGQSRSVEVIRLVSRGTVEEVMYERQIYKQSRARQLNDGTWERRIHSGFEGATDMKDKGELFGVHNIFRFNPDGFVAQNLKRIDITEEHLRQEFIDEEYGSDDDEDEYEGSSKIREERRLKARKLALTRKERDEQDDDQLFARITGEASEKDDRDVLSRLGVNAFEHNSVFRDSKEERDTYARGLKILEENPKLAKDLLANDIGKVKVKSRSSTGSGKRAKTDGEPKIDDEWKERVAANKRRASGGKAPLVNSDESDMEDG